MYYPDDSAREWFENVGGMATGSWCGRFHARSTVSQDHFHATLIIYYYTLPPAATPRTLNELPYYMMQYLNITHNIPAPEGERLHRWLSGLKFNEPASHYRAPAHR